MLVNAPPILVSTFIVLVGCVVINTEIEWWEQGVSLGSHFSSLFPIISPDERGKREKKSLAGSMSSKSMSPE
jgi:hypothetical protein